MSEGRRRRTKETNKKKVAQMSYLLDSTDHAEAFLNGLFRTFQATSISSSFSLYPSPDFLST